SNLQPSNPLREPLTPLPAAWLWLNAPRPERLQTLWQSWITPRPELWRAYRLPGYDWLTDPAALLTPLHQALPAIDPADPTRFAQTLLARQPDLLDLVPANRLEPVETILGAIVQLLPGPLVWLGALVRAEGRGLKDENIILALSTQGLAWLTGQIDPAVSGPAPAKFSITTHFNPDPFQSTLTLTLSDGLPDPADLMVALEVGTLCVKDEGGKQEAETVFHSSALILQPSSFIRALQRGWSAPALLEGPQPPGPPPPHRPGNRPAAPVGRSKRTRRHSFAHGAGNHRSGSDPAPGRHPPRPGPHPAQPLPPRRRRRPGPTRPTGPPPDRTGRRPPKG
ncbi:MAG: hypothetical protein AB1801_11205, partial [Chloroflexota bacterium]